MPVSLTLKNIPDAVYQRLKQSAEKNRRSMNSEAIVRLEASLEEQRADVQAQLERIRAVRVTLRSGPVKSDDIDAFKREGRP